MHAKYFAFSNVLTETSSITFVYSASNERIGQIEKGTPIKVVANTAYSTKFEIRYGDDQVGYVPNSKVRKPYHGKGASERLSIKAADLVAGGERRAFEGTEVAWFESKDALIKSMMDGLGKNGAIRPSILESFHNILRNQTATFQWPDDATQLEKNELGKYGGEFLPHVLWQDIKASAFPLNPAYPIIDSFIIHHNDSRSGLSSKFGNGAKASLFSLIYTDQIADNCIFKTLSTHYLNHESTMAAIYETGFSEIIPNTGANPIHIYNSLKNGETPLWLELFKPPDDEAVAKDWPMSLTAYFSRTIAKRLNECETSQKWLNSTVNQKNIFQVNLDIREWTAGCIKLDVKSFKDCSVFVTGSKSAIKDVRAKQGTINYELRRIDNHSE